jgi:hypothetical protein
VLAVGGHRRDHLQAVPAGLDAQHRVVVGLEGLSGRWGVEALAAQPGVTSPGPKAWPLQQTMPSRSNSLARLFHIDAEARGGT